MPVTDTDHGYQDLLKRVFIEAQRRSVVTIGIHAKEGERLEKRSRQDGAESETAMTVLEVATVNEFGSADGHVPARSFLRAWFDEQEPKMRRDLVILMQSVIAGKRTSTEILEILGARAVGQIQARIAQGIDPENAPATIKRKGSSTPLEDTGVLRSSITYQVEEAK